MLAAVKTASAPPCGGGLRPVFLTAAVRDAEPMCRPGRRNGASAERRNGRAFGYAANRRVLCGWLTKVRIEQRLSLQKHTGQAKQSVCDTTESTPVRVAALA